MLVRHMGKRKTECTAFCDPQGSVACYYQRERGQWTRGLGGSQLKKKASGRRGLETDSLSEEI